MRTTIGVTEDGKELYSHNHSHVVVPKRGGGKMTLPVFIDNIPHSHEVIEGNSRTSIVNGHFHKIQKPKRTGF